MPDEQSFLDALKKKPDDEATRLIFADWLEERGDPRAAWLRDPKLVHYMGVECKHPAQALVAELAKADDPTLARELLCHLGQDAVVALLRGTLEFHYECERIHDCLEQIAREDKHVAPHLMGLTSDKQTDRLKAVKALGKVGESAACAYVHLMKTARNADNDESTKLEILNAILSAWKQMGEYYPLLLEVAYHDFEYGVDWWVDNCKQLDGAIYDLGPDSGLVHLIIPHGDEYLERWEPLISFGPRILPTLLEHCDFNGYEIHSLTDYLPSGGSYLLSAWAPEVIPELFVRLNDENTKPDASIGIVMGLFDAVVKGRAGDHEEAIIHQLGKTAEHDSSMDVRNMALIGLRMCGTKSRPVLSTIVACLDDENGETRCEAIDALRIIGSVEADVVAKVHELEQDEDDVVRRSAKEFREALNSPKKTTKKKSK